MATSSLRWGRIVLGGVLAELILVVFVIPINLAGGGERAITTVAVAGSYVVFVPVAWWLSRALPRPILHGALMGVLVAAGWSWRVSGQARTGAPVAADVAVVYEGARLITGDGRAPIENSAFVVQNDRFTQVGRKGTVKGPAGATHVDLTGKTVMPGKVDTHGHFGFQHVADGTMAKEYFTQANLTGHLEILAYYGFSAAIGVGDLVD